MDIIDTNIILRFLVGDNKLQQKQAEIWLKQAEKNKREIMVAAIVVEVSFVLETFYKKKREDIADALEVFMSTLVACS